MAQTKQSTGRQDRTVPLFTSTTIAKMWIAGLVVALVGAWHLAVAATTTGTVDDLDHSVAHALSPGDVAARTWVVMVALLVAAALVLFALGRVVGAVRTRAGRGRGKGFADDATIRDHFSLQRAQDRAHNATMPLRPGLVKGSSNPAEYGFLLGRSLGRRQELIVPWDDHISVLAPTGAGKSRDIMIPAAQDAPGALVVTTNEATILDAIATARRAKGRVWVFDPLERTYWPERMVWDAVAGCADGERATARGTAFCAGVKSGVEREGGNAGFFKDTASTAMEALLHAAALDAYRTISDVLTWALEMGETVATPKRIIRESTSPQAEKMWERSLDGVATGAADTVASTRTTLQRHLKPLLRASVRAWVDPSLAPEGTPVFDPAAFVRSTDTLVLVSDDTSSSDVGPLCSMIFQEVMDAVTAYAPQTAGQRIEPPLRVVGDEVANVAPIPALPAMATVVRKLGVQLILAFQDDRQAISRWGEDAGMTLLSQMGVEVILPGVKSRKTLERVSGLASQVEVVERTDNVDLSGGQGRGQSAGLSMQTKPVMREDEVRQMQDGTALVLYRNVAAFQIQTVPWWERRGGKEASRDAHNEARRRAARAEATSPRGPALTAPSVLATTGDRDD